MDLRGRHAFIYSAMLHVLFLTALALGGFWDLLRRPPEPHVFTLVKTETRSIEPTETRVHQVVPMPVKKDPPKEKPVDRVSFEDFMATHGEPKIARPRTRHTLQVEYEEIDIEQIESNLAIIFAENDPEVQQVGIKEGDDILLLGYIDRLRTGINSAWEKPPSLQGKLFRATVRFFVNSRGKIEDVRITKSSGNKIFDKSVIDAFVRFVSIGPPPNAHGYRVKLTFRMVE